jgi:hypothetical protein
MCVLVFARLAVGTFVPAVLANLKKTPFYPFGSLDEKKIHSGTTVPNPDLAN